MDSFLNQLVAILFHLGGFGLVILGILDSSFLFMPLGNDLLIVALTVRNRPLLPLFALLAATGSVLGCLLVDWIARKGGQEGLGRVVSQRRLEYAKRKVQNGAGWTLAVASLMPPPFPFTPFVAAAAAFQYPRQRLLGVVAVSRFVRFFAVGSLALMFGSQIIRLSQLPAVRGAILALLLIFIAGSAFSIYSWLKRRRC